MTLRDGIRVLLHEARSYSILSYRDLRKFFHRDSDAAFHKGLRMLVEAGLLERVTRGTYLNLAATPMGFDAVGRLVRRLRAGHWSYLSYESALAEHGSINQVPLTSTFATTGPSGEFSTRYGVIEFVHTDRPTLEIQARTRYQADADTFVASPDLAKEDLTRARPHMLHLVDDAYHGLAREEWRASA